MRFSANLGLLWPDRPLLARIDAAGRAGFRAVEMHWPYDVSPGEVAATARLAGVTLLGINTAPGNFAAGERGLGAIPGRERDFQATVDQAVEYCRVSGASRTSGTSRSRAFHPAVSRTTARLPMG